MISNSRSRFTCVNTALHGRCVIIVDGTRFVGNPEGDPLDIGDEVWYRQRRWKVIAKDDEGNFLIKNKLSDVVWVRSKHVKLLNRALLG